MARRGSPLVFAQAFDVQVFVKKLDARKLNALARLLIFLPKKKGGKNSRLISIAFIPI